MGSTNNSAPVDQNDATNVLVDSVTSTLKVEFLYPSIKGNSKHQLCRRIRT